MNHYLGSSAPFQYGSLEMQQLPHLGMQQPPHLGMQQQPQFSQTLFPFYPSQPSQPSPQVHAPLALTPSQSPEVSATAPGPLSTRKESESSSRKAKKAKVQKASGKTDTSKQLEARPLYSRWTDEATSVLVENWAAAYVEGKLDGIHTHAAWSEIAQAAGRTIKTCKNKINALTNTFIDAKNAIKEDSGLSADDTHFEHFETFDRVMGDSAKVNLSDKAEAGVKRQGERVADVTEGKKKKLRLSQMVAEAGHRQENVLRTIEQSGKTMMEMLEGLQEKQNQMVESIVKSSKEESQADREVLMALISAMKK